MSEIEPTEPVDGKAQGDSDQHDLASLVATSDVSLRPLPVVEGLEEWDQLMSRAARLLRESVIDSAWVGRLTDLTLSVRTLARRNADMALYVLIQANGRGLDHYSAQHAMICQVIAELAAEWMEWPEEEKQSLALAALSMNVSMTALQDSLAKQSTALSEGQRELVGAHADASADLLIKAGVVEPVWLYVVQHHHKIHESDSGDAAGAGPRLAELLRRVDVYTAKLSSRGSRASITPAMAARDACLGAGGHPDSTGATLLRVVGLYPPGTFVELANGETAVVIERGKKAHTPIVASVRREDGGVLMQPLRRDTLRSGMTVKRGIEPSRVRVMFEHRRTLACAF